VVRPATPAWVAPIVAAGVALTVSGTVSGCSGQEMLASVGLRPAEETASRHGDAQAAPPGPVHAGGQSNALVVTPRQRAYLDALAAAGVQRSSDLAALSIGSHICQARAARHTDQQVWDYILPMVRSDVSGAARISSIAPSGRRPPSAAEVNAATADYIRIATERLC
jgi:hypothetical protein